MSVLASVTSKAQSASLDMTRSQGNLLLWILREYSTWIRHVSPWRVAMEEGCRGEWMSGEDYCQMWEMFPPRGKGAGV
jgi:hypothetical protein